MGSPSGSTISTCSSSHSSALRVRRSERTAGMLLVALQLAAHLLGLLAHAGGQGLDLGVEVVVVDLDGLGLGDGPQGEVGLDRAGGRRRAAPRRAAVLGATGGREVLLGLDALGREAAWPRSWRRARISCWTSGSGASSSTSWTRASTTFSRSAMVAWSLRTLGEAPGEVVAQLARRCRTRRPRWPTRRSTSGSTRSWTFLTRTRNDTRAAGAGELAVEGEGVADLGAR